MKRKIDTIFVHCSATRPNWMAGQSAQDKFKEIDRWHKARGFHGFGYHGLIDRDGTLVEGRLWEVIGAHVKGHNRNSLGICLVGGHGGSATDTFSDHFTEAQAKALRAWLSRALTAYPDAVVRGHNEVAAKACPCFDAGAWWEAHQQPVTDFVKDDTPKPQSPWAALIAALMALFGGKK